MGKKTQKLLFIRFILFVTFTTLILFDILNDTKIIDFIINHRILNTISIIHIFWLFVMFDMITIIIPKFNNNSYNGKHFLKHYLPAIDYHQNKLINHTKQNRRGALKSAIFWISFNLPFAILFFLGYLDTLFFYWLFFLYYFLDTFCINIFCIFHIFIVRNKCCNECRIYNWSYAMYCTPLLFIPDVWNYVLVLLSGIILIQWEFGAHFHPERFSAISNLTLQCQNCQYDCRYNTNKKNFIYYINKAGQMVYYKLRKLKSCIFK